MFRLQLWLEMLLKNQGEKLIFGVKYRKHTSIRGIGGRMSFFLGRGETVVREQSDVVYHRGYSRIGSIMSGKLILTNRRFLFLEQRNVKSGGLLGFGGKTETQTVGVKINLPIDNVVGAIVETRTRKKGTLNQRASLFSKEQYQILVVSLDTEQGMENPAFEVYNAKDWATAIQRAVGGEAV